MGSNSCFSEIIADVFLLTTSHYAALWVLVAWLVMLDHWILSADVSVEQCDLLSLDAEFIRLCLD